MRNRMRRFVILLGIGWVMQAPGLPLAAQSAPASASLSAAELAGKKLFLQRCSVCHLPPLGRSADSRPFGPLLKGIGKDHESEAGAREIIRKGTPRMPGFQYGLDSKEIDDLIAYLKTVR